MNSRMEFERRKAKREKEQEYKALFSEPTKLETAVHETMFWLMSFVMTFVYMYLIVLMCGGFNG